MAEYLTSFTIKIGGQKAEDDLIDDIIEIMVDNNVHMPDMFSLHIYDDTLKWVDDSRFDVGKPVEVSYDGTTIFQGELTNLEPDFDETGRATFLIRGYDKSHRLHRGRKSRTFTKQRDSAIAQKLAGEAGLGTDIDSTSITHDYLIQNNQTNMEFLMARAERIGYRVYAADGKLFFKKGTASRGTGPELKWNENLRSFRPRVAAVHQADKAIVRGWDPNTKKQIKGEAQPSSALKQGGISKTGGDTAKGAFGAAEAVVSHAPITNMDEAKAMAQAVCDEIGSEFIRAEGVCYGDPKLQAGYNVKVSDVGSRFSGTYFVTSTTHIYRDGLYETAFCMSGRNPDTVKQLLEPEQDVDRSRGLTHGVVVGLVTSNKDTEGLGRIKVKFPWLVNPDGVEIDSTWVRIASDMGGQAQKGIYTLPEIDDEVLVAFEHGDMRYPYLVGVLYNKKDTPPKKNDMVTKDGKTNQWIIQSRSGHIITLDDTSGKEKITITDKTGNNEMMIDSKKNNMAIKVDGDFSVTAKGKITLSSTKDMTLDTKANGTMKTTGDMKLQATKNLNAEAKMNSSVKGLQLALEAQTKGELKGLTVGVQGSTLTEVKGAIVKIN